MFKKQLLAGLCALFASSGAHAVPLTFDFSATVSSLSNAVVSGPGITGVGQLITGSFTFETDTPGAGAYFLPIIEFSYSIDGGPQDSLVDDGSGGIVESETYITNNNFFGNDVIDIIARVQGGNPDILVGGAPSVRISFLFNLEDSTGTTVNGLSLSELTNLPSIISDPGASLNFDIEFEAFGTEGLVFGRYTMQLNSLSEPVPEPGVSLLLGTGLFAAARAYRRRLRKHL